MDIEIEHWQDDEYPERQGEVAVFRLQTAKRHGFIRKAGLPIDTRYEPWTMDLVRYWQSRGDGVVFPITRNQAEYYVEARGIFSGISYPIETYGTIERHGRELCLHGLRHVRATNLMEDYRMDLEEVCIFGGWTLKSQKGRQVSSVLEKRYLQLGYRRYIRKLMRAPISPHAAQQTGLPSCAPSSVVPEPTLGVAQTCQSIDELMEARAQIEGLREKNEALLSLLRRVNEIDPSIIVEIQQGAASKRHRTPSVKAKVVDGEGAARLTYNAF